MFIGCIIPEEFFRAYNETGQLVMMLQEEVKFDMYFRCYSIDQRHVRIMPYEPRHPYHLRYQTEWQAPSEILEKVHEGVLTFESISRLRFEYGGVRYSRRRADGDRFLQSGAGRRSGLGRSGQLRMGRRSGFRHGDSESARTCSRPRQLELGQICASRGEERKPVGNERMPNASMTNE